MTESTNHPLSGLWKPRPLQSLLYGAGSVEKHLVGLLPCEESRAFIVTGNSLATKTPLIKDLEALLGDRHAGTFSKIGQHAPVAQLDEATELVGKDGRVDTVISVGGGSPIDSSKVISHRMHDKHGKWLFHIAIPTTLSAAECTQLAGYTQADGVKTGLNDPKIAVDAIIYDPKFGRHTPKKLWLTSGVRALDHAVETLYHPSSSEVPAKVMALGAAERLFRLLPAAAQAHPDDDEAITQLFLAAYMSLGFLGTNLTQGLGLSHSLGYALGSPYQIPHGETSCLTLGHVVQLKAQGRDEDAEQISRLLPHIGGRASGDTKGDATEVGGRILRLVEDLGLKQSLTERGVAKDQLDIIVQRATGGQKEGPLYDAVKGLVEGLW